MKVRDLMSKGIVTIEDTANCHEAGEKMVRHRVRHLPVVTRRGTLCGIVTDRDLRHYLFEPETFRQVGTVRVETLLKAIPVSRVMSSPVITVDADEPLEDRPAAPHRRRRRVLLRRGHHRGVVPVSDGPGSQA
jgi:CBS domain-containing protein